MLDAVRRYRKHTGALAKKTKNRNTSASAFERTPCTPVARYPVMPAAPTGGEEAGRVYDVPGRRSARL